MGSLEQADLARLAGLLSPALLARAKIDGGDLFYSTRIDYITQPISITGRLAPEHLFLLFAGQSNHLTTLPDRFPSIYEES